MGALVDSSGGMATAGEGSGGTAGSGSGKSRESLHAALRFVLGGASGAFAKTLVAPFDRVKIIFQISRMPFSYLGMVSELQRTVRVDGWVGLFRGNLAQVVRVLPYSGSQLCCFDMFSSLLLRYRGSSSSEGSSRAGNGSSAASHLSSLDRVVAGASAGAVSVVLTYPLDLLRARLAVAQELPGGTPKPIAGLWTVMRDMVRSGGVLGMYRGLSPTLVGILPYAGISFAVYEALKDTTRKANKGAGLTTRNREPVILERFFFGGIAGFAGQAAAYPFDIVRRS
jgi:solute carrier family 25 protein 42